MISWLKRKFKDWENSRMDKEKAAALVKLMNYYDSLYFIRNAELQQDMSNMDDKNVIKLEPKEIN